MRSAAISIPVSRTTRTSQPRPKASSIACRIPGFPYFALRSLTCATVRSKSLCLTVSSTNWDKSPFFRPCWARYTRKARSMSAETTRDQRVEFIVSSIHCCVFIHLYVYLQSDREHGQQASVCKRKWALFLIFNNTESIFCVMSIFKRPAASSRAST